VNVVDHQDVVAGAADQSVWIGAAIEDVVARAAIQQIPARFAGQAIVAAAAEQAIVAGAAEQAIVPSAAEQAVIARAAEQLVVAGSAIQQIIAFVAKDGIVARSAEQLVVERGAVDHVVPVGPGDERPDSALWLRAIHIRGAAFTEVQPVGRRAETKRDAHAGHDHRAAIGAGRGCGGRHQRSARRARGECCGRRPLARRQRVEDLAAARRRSLAGMRGLSGGAEPGRRQVVMPCCARFALARSGDAAARRSVGSGVAQRAFAFREQNADQGRGQRRPDHQAVEIEPGRPRRALRRAAGGTPALSIARTLRVIRIR
jgi:hypothetical protein